ncbi:MAG: HAMP domain-containing sensor histidine kinase [Chitinophagales bacterium]|nr:HAMP domain-containing sensor histidine kinase [Chitinophagales bacterium]
MNLYEQNARVKIVFLIAGLLIVVASVVYTNIISKRLAEQEKKKVALWANAYRNLNQANENTDLGFLFEVIKENETVPVILTDSEGSVLSWRNFDSVRVKKDTTYLKRQLVQMKKDKEPLEIEVAPGVVNYIYYKDSYPLVQLRTYPFVQLGIIVVFIGLAYITLMTSKTAEQNRVWVGMAKETAHQLGTPISSLTAWVEFIKETGLKNDDNGQMAAELEKDVNRLALIADRFSKIGSKPSLESKNVYEYLNKSMDYIKRRASQQVAFKLEGDTMAEAQMNVALFDWVIENLLKNALDAMNGLGAITVKVSKEDAKVIIDIADTGKGIPKSKFKTVFQPGYSTKKRGWGLGLTLTKRIIENYHSGRIFVKESSPEGTTFRIILPA